MAYFFGGVGVGGIAIGVIASWTNWFSVEVTWQIYGIGMITFALARIIYLMEQKVDN